MKIKFLGATGTSEYDDLVFYLSQVVLTKTDDAVKKKNQLVNSTKDQITKLKSSINKLKEECVKIENVYAKEKQVKRILNLILTLKKEGGIRGSIGKEILMLLNKIDTLDFQKLMDIEKKLSLYRPG